MIGEVGGDALTIEGVLSVALVDLERAHTTGLAGLLHWPSGNNRARPPASSGA